MSGYLTISRISGEPEVLIEGYRRSAPTMDGVGSDHGLVLHAAAKTPDGLLIVNLWPARERSEAASGDQRRAHAIQSQDLDPSRIAPEHFELERYRLFGAPA